MTLSERLKKLEKNQPASGCEPGCWGRCRVCPDNWRDELLALARDMADALDARQAPTEPPVVHLDAGKDAVCQAEHVEHFTDDLFAATCVACLRQAAHGAQAPTPRTALEWRQAPASGDRCPLGPLQLHTWQDGACIHCDARQAPAEPPIHPDVQAAWDEAARRRAEPPTDLQETIAGLERVRTYIGSRAYVTHGMDYLRFIDRALSLLRQRLAAPVARPAGARDEDETVPPIPLHWAEGGTVRHSQPASPPADTAALLADGERLPELIEQRLRDALQDEDLEPWMYSQPGAEAIEAFRSWIVAVVRAALTAGASPEEQ